MPINREDTRWNGWGWTKAHNPVEGREAVWQWIAEALQVPELAKTPAKELDQIKLPESKLIGLARSELIDGLGAANVRESHYERAAHARGKSYLDLLYLRAGDLSAAPDAVVYPHSSDEIVTLLRWAEKHHVAVVPFAGGSSVVGGLTGTAAGFSAVVALDLTEMNRFDEAIEAFYLKPEGTEKRRVRRNRIQVAGCGPAAPYVLIPTVT